MERKINKFFKKIVLIILLSNVCIIKFAHAKDDDLEKLNKIISAVIDSNIHINSKEVINLKGIEFKGDVKNDLIDLCKSENKSNFECKYDENNVIDLGLLTYGNLIKLVILN